MPGLRPLTASIIALLLTTAQSLAQQRSAFDGTWDVILTCTAAQDGAAGYIFRFQASVQGGRFHGEHGVQGQASYLALDGQIQPDGNAMLSAQGLTGSPIYTVGRLQPTTPYSYHLQSQFQGTHGTGKRIEVRPCEAVFSKL